MIKNERQLWKKLKDETPSISWIRIENWALPGTPDLLGYNNNGTFFTVELKYTKSTLCEALSSPDFISC